MMDAFKIKRFINLTVKNQFGWKTDRKIIVFSVDDYGNVRMASGNAWNRMKKDGLNVESNRFDKFDSLEDEEDLLQLYDCLASVKDKKGSHAIFTTFSLVANPDFDKIIASNYNEYYYETLPDTYQKIKGYENVLNIVKEGIDKRLIFPQFHGREHLNIRIFEYLLQKKDKEIISAINNNSYAGISSRPFKNIGYTSAFGLSSIDEIEDHKLIIKDGLDLFQKIYGYNARHFTSPGTHAHIALEKTLKEGGIDYIDTDILKKEHQGRDKYKRRFNYTGKKNNNGQYYMVRNCIYEPLLDPNIDWVDYCLFQIENAFRWHKPANISSHRVNFCGHIDPVNRENGLRGLKKLLKKIVEKWPDVEFLSTVELGDLISESQE